MTGMMTQAPHSHKKTLGFTTFFDQKDTDPNCQLTAKKARTVSAAHQNAHFFASFAVDKFTPFHTHTRNGSKLTKNLNGKERTTHDSCSFFARFLSPNKPT
jgi:hypothetical protein